ncbi:glycosyl transferase, group 2 family protein [Synechococcus sp. PCC 7335]|uniref:glycosyltransferase n=1 Tax=Synechococcus sp. (strain ATCC 29403 / PCC 7335) TaxID=91464 RepID=UPI00017EB44E|nr:glycosyltransferase [Synechococcus sp. PCC 7335]EDX84839.1 glycosyl transferase, group 2 family protein [Synechococcus sp. PCC 7335]
METAFFWSTTLAVIIWVVLLLLWGQFWRADQQLSRETSSINDLQGMWPSVAVVIPARNEAALIEKVVRSHLTQTYPGTLSILLIDDKSTDKTAQIAIQTAQKLDRTEILTVLSGTALPTGWTGKLWALEQGFQYLRRQSNQPDYVLFTDADIEHSSDNLQRLVTKAESEKLDLVSLMVQLRTQSFWEDLLIPAFIFFFQLLYPFPWVNNPQKKTAAAAGGCVLLRFDALSRINGLQVIRKALIDDCALGAAVKKNGPIWLGLSNEVKSLRPYPSLESLWQMVARSAYTQLHYSPFLLVGTVIGMALVYWGPPLGFLVGLVVGSRVIALLGLLGWLMMAFAYWPTLRLYKRPAWMAFLLPIIALLYTLMTIDSALQYWTGKGSEWKGRMYSDSRVS